MMEDKKITQGQMNFIKWVLDYKKLNKKEIINLKALIQAGTYWKGRDRANMMNRFRNIYLEEYKEWLKPTLDEILP